MKYDDTWSNKPEDWEWRNMYLLIGICIQKNKMIQKENQTGTFWECGKVETHWANTHNNSLFNFNKNQLKTGTGLYIVYNIHPKSKY